MEYKGYVIKAEVTESNYWSLDQNGNIHDREEDGAQFDITGYFIFKDGLEMDFQSMSESGPEELRAMVDSYIEGLGELA